MKAKRLLFLIMTICLASGVRAQFYDGPEDIYYYVKYENGEYGKIAQIFNFDGKKAFNLTYKYDEVNEVKQNLLSNPNYYEELIETLDYNMFFIESNSSGTIYGYSYNDDLKFTFSKDRQFVTTWQKVQGLYGNTIIEFRYKKVDKSYFRVGRSRTPSGKMYE